MMMRRTNRREVIRYIFDIVKVFYVNEDCVNRERVGEERIKNQYRTEYG